jgi:hypothetical protein
MNESNETSEFNTTTRKVDLRLLLDEMLDLLR